MASLTLPTDPLEREEMLRRMLFEAANERLRQGDAGAYGDTNVGPISSPTGPHPLAPPPQPAPSPMRAGMVPGGFDTALVSEPPGTPGTSAPSQPASPSPGGGGGFGAFLSRIGDALTSPEFKERLLLGVAAGNARYDGGRMLAHVTQQLEARRMATGLAEVQALASQGNLTEAQVRLQALAAGARTEQSLKLIQSVGDRLAKRTEALGLAKQVRASIGNVDLPAGPASALRALESGSLDVATFLKLWEGFRPQYQSVGAHLVQTDPMGTGGQPKRVFSAPEAKTVAPGHTLGTQTFDSQGRVQFTPSFTAPAAPQRIELTPQERVAAGLMRVDEYQLLAGLNSTNAQERALATMVREQLGAKAQALGHQPTGQLAAAIKASGGDPSKPFAEQDPNVLRKALALMPTINQHVQLQRPIGVNASQFVHRETLTHPDAGMSEAAVYADRNYIATKFESERVLLMRSPVIAKAIDEVRKIVKARPDIYVKGTGDFATDQMALAQSRVKFWATGAIDKDISRLQRSFALFGPILNRYSGDTANTALAERAANLEAMALAPMTQQSALAVLDDLERLVKDSVSSLGVDYEAMKRKGAAAPSDEGNAGEWTEVAPGVRVRARKR